MERPVDYASSAQPGSRSREFGRRAAILALFLAVAALLWYVADVLLLAFAGVLLEVFLDFLAGKLSEAARIRRGWAFAIVAVGISVLLGVAAWIAMPRVADQVSQLIRTLPQSMATLQAYLAGREWG